MTVPELVARCEELYNDLDLAYVKEWKARTGAAAIGYMPIYVPREIIHAAGMLPVGIMGGSDNVEIIRGDAYYQSYICHIPRSTVELGLTGRLDCIDGFLFPAICDVIRNLSGMWKMMFEEKYVRYMDYPQNFAASIGGDFYHHDLKTFSADLEGMSGARITDEALAQSIALFNENRRAIEQLYQLRAENPHRVPSYELYLLMRASNILEVTEHTELVNTYVDKVATFDRPEMDNIRVVITGVFCEQPSLGLIRALEQSGCYIVEDDWMLGARFITGDIDPGTNPLRSLADAYLEKGVATSSRYIDKEEKGRHLINRVQALDAEGVIFASPSFCDPALLERPMLQTALNQANIPHTSFKFSENSGQYQVIKEQTGTFSDSIKLWGDSMSESTTAQKEQSMTLQKEMIAAHYKRLASAKESGKKVVYTFVPGNLNELIWSFDMLPVHPEINALQSAMRHRSGGYVQEAEKFGHSEDVCTYVKCDIGMMKKGNIGPTGEPLPEPDLLLLSYTGCFTFMKWFELLKEEYDCPVAMLHTPYQGDGEITDQMVEYITKQLRDEIIPLMEQISGNAFDEDALRARLASSARAEDDLVAVWESAKHTPSPIDAYFGGVYYIGPIFSAFRGHESCEEYYRTLRSEVDERLRNHQGPITPDGSVNEEKYRIVVEGPPNWTSFREFWKMFYSEGAVVVNSTYTKVGGLYDNGFRHDPERPLATLAEYCLGCYTNLNLPTRIAYLEKAINDYNADGFLINSIKSCNSFSAGQLLILRELEKRTGKAGGFIESDLVDPRYFSAANIKNRLESYFQMIDAKRQGA